MDILGVFVVYALAHFVCMHAGLFGYLKGRYINVISLYPLWNIYSKLLVGK